MCTKAATHGQCRAMTMLPSVGPKSLSPGTLGRASTAVSAHAFSSVYVTQLKALLSPKLILLSLEALNTSSIGLSCLSCPPYAVGIHPGISRLLMTKCIAISAP